jgi:protein involved in polysaccharide export with SLBB domain
LEFKNTTFKDIINNAGGLTKYANLKYSQLYRKGKVITIDFNKLNEHEYIFEDGDVINIASNKGIVTVTGAIENESNFIWKKGLRAKSYIKNSGGKARKESGKSYVILSNGKSKKINFFKNPIVFPNSTIIVNKKVKKERKDTSEFLKDFNSTFGIIASTLMTILLASRL